MNDHKYHIVIPEVWLDVFIDMLCNYEDEGPYPETWQSYELKQLVDSIKEQLLAQKKHVNC